MMVLIAEQSQYRGGKIGIAPVAITFLALALASTIWLIAGKEDRPTFPANGEILGEGFGAPLRIGMSLEAARKAVAESKVKPVFLTREELALRNLYQERPRKEDLLAVIYGKELGSGEESISGLRGYLAGVEESRLTLAGKPAAALSSELVKEIFGEPFNASTGQDARTHLTFYFADPQFPGMTLKLTTSHEYDGRMFSLALERVFAPQ